jgi:site-specific recombinase XerD
MPETQKLNKSEFDSFKAITDKISTKIAQKNELNACANHLDTWLNYNKIPFKNFKESHLQNFIDSLNNTIITWRKGKIIYPELTQIALTTKEENNKRIGLKKSTQNSRLNALKKIFRLITPPSHQEALEAFFERNKPTRLKSHLEAHHFFKKDEIDKVIHDCFECDKRSKTKRRTGHLIKMLFYTGLRFNEATGIKLSDIHHHNEIAHITVTGKGSKERTIYIKSTWIYKIISELNPKTYLFETHQENQLDPSNSLKVIKRVFKKVHGEMSSHKIEHHALRHSFAMYAINDKPNADGSTGIDLSSVSSYLGHSDVSTTLNFYTHPNTKPDTFI